SQDQSVQKKLQFGPTTGSGFNNNRSKLEIASTGGFQLTSSAGNPPSLMDWIGTTGTTYYTFVDSGAFTATYSTITHTDSNGIWLNGNSGINMSSVTFDLAGNGGSSSSTYITANALVSTMTFYG